MLLTLHLLLAIGGRRRRGGSDVRASEEGAGGRANHYDLRQPRARLGDQDQGGRGAALLSAKYMVYTWCASAVSRHHQSWSPWRNLLAYIRALSLTRLKSPCLQNVLKTPRWPHPPLVPSVLAAEPPQCQSFLLTIPHPREAAFGGGSVVLEVFDEDFGDPTDFLGQVRDEN